MNKPYVITSPPFDPVSGGVRVMYGLYGLLLAKGQEAYLNARPPGDVIGIYPEIQEGNPANAETVVRYILNKPGVVDAIYSDGSIKKGPTEFAPTDRLYYFSRLFGQTDDASHYLFLPILNLHLFRDRKKLRTKKAYFVGKAIHEIGFVEKFIHPKDAILIDRSFALNQQALADLLNECEVLYCYDPVTAMTEVARLCGCRIVMINPLYTQAEFSRYEPGMNGISWGQDTGEKLWVADFRERYLWLLDDFEVKLEQFIEDTQ